MVRSGLALMVVSCLSSGWAWADDRPDPPSAPAARPKLEKATFAGGCFWSMEAVFERVPGVKDVVSGFSGGGVANPSYERVGTGSTGHAESVEVTFDPSVVTYETLLKAFWKAHDPTTPNQQGDDFGPQYRSMIFYRDEAQRQAALRSHQELKARRAFRAPVVTELAPFRAFYPAEPYHQDYYVNHRGNTYCDVYIVPKLRKLHLLGTSRTRKPPAASLTTRDRPGAGKPAGPSGPAPP